MNNIIHAVKYEYDMYSLQNLNMSRGSFHNINTVTKRLNINNIEDN